MAFAAAFVPSRPHELDEEALFIQEAPAPAPVYPMDLSVQKFRFLAPILFASIVFFPMSLAQHRVAVLVDKSFEDLEFWVPVMRLREEQASVVVAGRDADRTFTGKHGLTATTEVAARDLDPDELDGVVVPGGWAPDKLRRDDGVTTLVRAMDDRGKIVGQICHAGLVGISAGIVDGRRATGSQGIKDDLINAGAEWVDQAAFRDQNQVWGRVVKDIPAFCRTLVSALKEAPQ